VENGADVQRNIEVLSEACRNGYNNIVKCLVEHGVDIQHALTEAYYYRQKNYCKIFSGKWIECSRKRIFIKLGM
jgi:hypothetical protein